MNDQERAELLALWRDVPECAVPDLIEAGPIEFFDVMYQRPVSLNHGLRLGRDAIVEWLDKNSNYDVLISAGTASLQRPAQFEGHEYIEPEGEHVSLLMDLIRLVRAVSGKERK